MENQTLPAHSARRRVAATLLVNCFKLAVGVVTTTIVPRVLGPVNFGNYNFLLRVTGSIRGFFNLGTPSAFFTYCAKNTQSRTAFVLYNIWVVLELMVVMVLISFSFVFGLKGWIFPGQTAGYIFAIAILEWMNFLALLFIQFGEAKAESIYVQKISFVSNIVKLLGLLILFQLKILTLDTFIIVSYISALVIIPWALWFILSKRKQYLAPATDPPLERKKVVSYFLEYCKPLVVYEAFGLVSNVFDRWFLQTIAGAVQQAYFSVAFGWSSVVLIFSTSVLNVYWRETSFAFGRNDLDRVRKIYTQLYNFLLFLSVFCAYFIVFNSNKLVGVLVGKAYGPAQAALVWMAFFSVYSTIGQINSIFFYAVEEVKLYRNLSIIGMVTSVVFAYFFLAPKTYFIPGFSLGATGLAAETLLMQFICTNLQLFYILKLLKLNFGSFLFKQARVFILLGFVSCSLSWVAGGLSIKPIFQMMVMLLLYAMTAVTLVWFWPVICGLTKAELIAYRDKAMSLFKIVKG